MVTSGEGGGHWGAPLFFVGFWRPPMLSLSLRLLNIVTSGEGGALGGAKILQKIMAPPLSIIKIVKYCDVWGGGGALGGAKILQKIMVPPLSVIKIVKYGDVWGGGGALGAPKSYKK